MTTFANLEPGRMPQKEDTILLLERLPDRMLQLYIRPDRYLLTLDHIPVRVAGDRNMGLRRLTLPSFAHAAGQYGDTWGPADLPSFCVKTDAECPSAQAARLIACYSPSEGPEGIVHYDEPSLAYARRWANPAGALARDIRELLNNMDLYDAPPDDEEAPFDLLRRALAVLEEEL